MDPQATICYIKQCLDDRDLDEAMEALHNLHRWVNRGGFLPTPFTRHDLLGLRRECLQAIVEG